MKILLFILSFYACAEEFTEAFIVTVEDQKVMVTSPKAKSDNISVIVKNNTFEDIRSEIASDKGVIKRFNLKAQSSRSLLIDYKDIKTLFYVSVAPPFQAVELKFSQKPYEIP